MDSEVKSESQTTRFSDVHGCDEAKDELQELVEFLKNPDKFSSLGGKLPKGILLVGPTRKPERRCSPEPWQGRPECPFSTCLAASSTKCTSAWAQSESVTFSIPPKARRQLSCLSTSLTPLAAGVMRGTQRMSSRR